MKKSLVEIYALSVCMIVTLWALSICTMMASNVLGFFNPDWTVADGVQYSSNDAYCAKNSDACGAFNSRTNIEIANPNDTASVAEAKAQAEKAEKEQNDKYGPEAITKKRETAYAAERDDGRKTATQNIATEGLKLCLMAMFFAVHWQIGRKARESQKVAG